MNDNYCRVCGTKTKLEPSIYVRAKYWTNYDPETGKRRMVSYCVNPDCKVNEPEPKRNWWQRNISDGD